ncbi:MAG: TIGR04282 family arsenosugar biosynthesis glycosyltransferase [Desulfobacteraceae bacterium]|nr:TIGR04282 family arsenosugar biosynthesis glycosyltransferase [Desulfobacteraceae bacterium]
MKKFNPQHCIIVFVKAPLEGLVKTRLAGCLGARGALLLYRALAADVLGAVCAMDCQVRVFYYPANHQDIVRGWLGDHIALYVQQGADLGQRMHHALCCTAADGFERIVLIGSDIPGIDEQILKSAFSALETSPAVLGPAKDGGYYLVGFRSGSIFPQAFDAIDWGCSDVFEQTMKRFEEKGQTPAVLPVLSDIDTPEDLRVLAVQLAGGGGFQGRLLHTRDVLGQMKIV